MIVMMGMEGGSRVGINLMLMEYDYNDFFFFWILSFKKGELAWWIL